MQSAEPTLEVWEINPLQCPARGVNEGAVLMSWLSLISVALQKQLVVCMKYPQYREFCSKTAISKKKGWFKI